MHQPLASPVYARAPITEAVIEIRVGGEIDNGTVEKIAHRLKKRYPNTQPLKEFEVKLDATGATIEVQQQNKGQRLSSNDQAEIVLIKTSSLVTSRLPRYPGWDVFRATARENWQSWRSAAPAYNIDRVGVRFINRLDLPSGEIRLADYLAIYPEVAPVSAGRPISNFTFRVSLPTYKPLWNANITLATVEPAPVPEKSSILLDLDVYRQDAIPLKDEALWAVIDEAREIKNDLFERSLTKQSKDLFQA